MHCKNQIIQRPKPHFKIRADKSADLLAKAAVHTIANFVISGWTAGPARPTSRERLP